MRNLASLFANFRSRGSLVFGLGSGRSGTTSLAALLNSQPDTIVFHEMNPASMSWCGADHTILSTLRDYNSILSGDRFGITVDLSSPNRSDPLDKLQANKRISHIGDVGSYYLPYVELIMRNSRNPKFPCIVRDKNSVVESFVKKLTASNSERPRNHWAKHPSRNWSKDEKWDKCFPTLNEVGKSSLEEFIAEYYDIYYSTARELEKNYPSNFRIFNVEHLNSVAGCQKIVEFSLGIRYVCAEFVGYRRNSS